MMFIYSGSIDTYCSPAITYQKSQSILSFAFYTFAQNHGISPIHFRVPPNLRRYLLRNVTFRADASIHRSDPDCQITVTVDLSNSGKPPRTVTKTCVRPPQTPNARTSSVRATPPEQEASRSSVTCAPRIALFSRVDLLPIFDVCSLLYFSFFRFHCSIYLLVGFYCFIGHMQFEG